MADTTEYDEEAEAGAVKVALESWPKTARLCLILLARRIGVIALLLLVLS